MKYSRLYIQYLVDLFPTYLLNKCHQQKCGFHLGQRFANSNNYWNYILYMFDLYREHITPIILVDIGHMRGVARGDNGKRFVFGTFLIHFFCHQFKSIFLKNKENA